MNLDYDFYPLQSITYVKFIIFNKKMYTIYSNTKGKKRQNLNKDNYKLKGENR